MGQPFNANILIGGASHRYQAKQLYLPADKDSFRNACHGFDFLICMCLKQF